MWRGTSMELRIIYFLQTLVIILLMWYLVNESYQLIYKNAHFGETLYIINRKRYKNIEFLFFICVCVLCLSLVFFATDKIRDGLRFQEVKVLDIIMENNLFLKIILFLYSIILILKVSRIERITTKGIVLMGEPIPWQDFIECMIVKDNIVKFTVKKKNTPSNYKVNYIVKCLSSQDVYKTFQKFTCDKRL